MMLHEIASSATTANTLRVPSWALGCVRRRSITFGTGVEDAQTRVFWVQAHGMTGDLRIHPARPSLPAGADLATLDRETLSLLASVEGGVATTSWSEPIMSWADWVGFQPYDKYLEPGIMRRVGDCMVEFAPSGAYVEDWRFLPSAPGLLAALRLEAEVDNSGHERSRAGGLVVAGDYAIRTFARRDELPEGTRAQDFVRSSPDPVAALLRVFDCVTDYMVRSESGWIIEASTDPRREGTTVALIGALSAGPGATLVEAVADTPDVSRRRWRIDSLEGHHVFGQATAVSQESLEWLAREADTLLDPLTKTLTRKVA
jgi:hypothetical protein